MRQISQVLFILLFVAVAAACAAQNSLTASKAESYPTVTITLTPTLSVTPTPTQPTSTPSPTLSPTPTLTPTLTPTATLLPNIRWAPPALIMHASDEQLEGKMTREQIQADADFLREFIRLAKEDGYTFTTYAQLETVQKPMILIIDRFRWGAYYPSRYPLVPELFKVLSEAGVPCVAAPVTDWTKRFDQYYDIREKIQKQGWQVGTNGNKYTDLSNLDWYSIVSYAGTGLVKISDTHKTSAVESVLVLPLGLGGQTDSMAKAVRQYNYIWEVNNQPDSVRWVVGTENGEQYDTTVEYYYVGAQEMLPADDPQTAAKLTLERIEARFVSP